MLINKKLHSWDVSPEEAVRVQKDLRRLVRIGQDITEIRTVAGVDVGYSKANGTATACIVVLTFPQLELVEAVSATEIVDFPYIPGLLSFREVPAIMEAFDLVASDPDVIFVDGQGIAHPRRFGIASHIGVLTDKPTIGCAKSRLTGHYEQPGPNPGDSSPLMADGERLGSVLRTKARVNPMFISPGHKVSFETADELVMACTKGYRLPEPTRLADRLVSRSTSSGAAP